MLTGEQLRDAIRAVGALPGAGRYAPHRIDLNAETVADVAQIAALAGLPMLEVVYAADPPLDSVPYVIVVAEGTIDGVLVYSQAKRPATDAEAARLSEAVPHGGPTIAVCLSDARAM